jgi:hypothetical protein
VILQQSFSVRQGKADCSAALLKINNCMCHCKVLIVVTPLLRHLMCLLLCLVVVIRAVLVYFIERCRSRGKRPYTCLAYWLYDYSTRLRELTVYVADFR